MDEKEKNDETRRVRMLPLALALLVMLAGVALGALVPGIDPLFVTVFMSVGLAMLVATIVRMARPERYVKDEMTIAIQRAAMSYSWSLTFLLVAVVVFLLHFRVIAMAAEDVLSLVMFAMVVFMALGQWYAKERMSA